MEQHGTWLLSGVYAGGFECPLCARPSPPHFLMGCFYKVGSFSRESEGGILHGVEREGGWS